MATSKHTGIGFAEVNGTRLYYEVQGAGQSLTMIHGGLVNLRSWDSQVVAFAPDYKVIRYDLRGMGASDTLITTPFSHEEDLHSLLKFLGVERTYLLGLSFGGRTAINFTLAHPEMVDALILASSSIEGYEFSEESKRLWAEIDEVAEKGDIDQAVELETRMWIDGPERTPEQVDPVVRKLVYDWNRHNFDLMLREGQAEPVTPEPPAITRLSEIAVPTLVIVGDKDLRDMQNIADRLAQEIKGAQKAVIPGVAHAPNMEKPAEFNQAVLDFLKTV
ncbi:MAG: alpha/beta hydrolase [Ktedonobacteraceae bacterium]